MAEPKRLVHKFARKNGWVSMLLDCEDTWPERLTAILQDGLRVLTAYEERRAEIDLAAQADIFLRVRPPPNVFEGPRAELLAECEELAAGTNLIGWHCTRLTKEEADDVRIHGLRKLSNALALERIAKAETQCLLPPSIITCLRKRSLAGDQGRLGMIHLILSRTLLRDAEGVYRLLGFWGGEALYGPHGDRGAVPTRLRHVGRPSLVEVMLPAEAIQSYCTPGERAMRVFLGRRGIKTGQTTIFTGSLHGLDIPPQQIRRIISRNEHDFEELTGCSSWDGKHRI